MGPKEDPSFPFSPERILDICVRPASGGSLCGLEFDRNSVSEHLEDKGWSVL
jgi:hypothetical protein